MIINEELRKDIIEWDTINWGKFIDFIDNLGIEIKNRSILDIGARNGGLSLYFAMKGGNVLCSDLEGPSQLARELHKKYKVDGNIKYAAIDATYIPEEYNDSFDIITFKSVLGGIGSCNNIDNQQKCVASVTRCLKPGGYLIFAENMKATNMHMFLRKIGRKHGQRWHYETEEEILTLFNSFTLIKKEYVGFIGCLGKGERGRTFLGKMDQIVFNRITSENQRYIGMYAFQKNLKKKEQ